MNISQLAKTVERTHSLAQILHAAAAVIAREMRCGACSIFLLEPGKKRPALSAGFREAMALADAFAPEIAVELAAQAVSRMEPETRREAARSLLAAPMVLRERAVGAIVVESAAGAGHGDAGHGGF
jgi:GAF domain-containing protein